MAPVAEITPSGEVSFAKQVQEALNTINQLDFTLAKIKLMEPTYEGWSSERAEIAERDYKRYLAVCKVLGRQLVPYKDLDVFWHEHILDTARYAKDCQEIFGYFFHHYPYFGMRGETDRARWQEVWRESNMIWQELFGEPMRGSDASKCPQSCPNPF